jgi:hypothetical protein
MFRNTAAAPVRKAPLGVMVTTALLSGALGDPARASAEPCETPRSCDFSDEPVIVTPKASPPPRSTP